MYTIIIKNAHGATKTLYFDTVTERKLFLDGYLARHYNDFGIKELFLN